MPSPATRMAIFSSLRYVLAVLLDIAILLECSLQILIPITWLTMPENHLSPSQQGMVSSFWAIGDGLAAICGLFVSALPIGRIYVLVFTSFFTCAIANLLLPTTLLFFPYATFVVSFMTGFARIIYYISYMKIVPYWTPDNENTTLTTIFHCGFLAGRFVGQLFAPLIIEATNWMFPYVLFGNCLLFTTMGIFLFLTDKPEDHKYISTKEKKYIISKRTISSKSTNSSDESIFLRVFNAPWKQVLTSIPVWLTVMVRTTRAGTMFFYIFFGVKFLIKKTSFSITESGKIVAMQFAIAFVSSLACGYLSDKIRRAGCATTAVRKIVLCVGHCIEIVGLIILIFSTENSYFVIGFVLLSFGMGFVQTTDSVIALEIAPQLYSFIESFNYAIVAFITSGCLYIVQMATSETSESQYEWTIVLTVIILYKIVSTACFLPFYSSDIQPWDRSL